jgi:hypothetical protein
VITAMLAPALLAALVAQASPSPEPSPSASPAPTALPAPTMPSVVGQVLALQDGYLLFTTGDALRVLPDASVPEHLRLGALVRVRLDPAAHAVAAIAYAHGGVPGDIDAEHVPREYVVASPKSLRTEPPAGDAGASSAASAATVTIDLRVPDSTPPTDDVYLATDRSNFSAAEVRMLRIDAQHFSASLRLAVGTQLRYEFSRGNFTSIERDKLGGIVEPRTIDVRGNVTVHDAVARWADVN